MGSVVGWIKGYVLYSWSGFDSHSNEIYMTRVVNELSLVSTNRINQPALSLLYIELIINSSINYSLFAFHNGSTGSGWLFLFLFLSDTIELV